jgi:hypothetical protein
MSRCRMDAPIRRSEEEEEEKMIVERAGRIAQKWRSRWAGLSPDRNENYTNRPAVSRRPARS